MVRTLPRVRCAFATGALSLLLGVGVAAATVEEPEGGEPPVVVPSPLSLPWCLERAAGANPQIAVSAAAADAAEARIRPAGRLDDPRVGYEASNLPVGDFDFNSTPLSGHQIGLRQRLPFPGLLHSRASAARAGHEASRFEVADRSLAVAGGVEGAWAELGFAQRALAITRRNIELLRHLAAIAETKYRVGEGLQQDVLRAQVQLTSLLEEELGRRAAITTAGASLGALLDLPPLTALPSTSPLDDGSVVPDVEAVLETLDRKNPQLLALARRIDEANERIRVAQIEGYPDFDVGLGYRIRRNVPGDPVEGQDFFSAGLTVRLPVDRTKWNARVAEARAHKRRAEAEYRGALATLRARVRAAHAELERADAAWRLVETGLRPQAQQSLESSRSGYEVGRIDFLALLNSQVSLLGAELRGVRALADRRSAFASLEVAAGEKLR